jgi:hypothetical protein
MGLDHGKRLHNLNPKRQATVTLSGVVSDHPDITGIILD